MDKGKIEKYFFKEIILFLIYLGIYFLDDKRLIMYIHTRIRHSRTTPRKISTHHCCCFTVLQIWVKMSLSLDYLFPLVDFLHFETNMKQCVHFKSMCSNVFLTRSLWFSLSSLLLLIDSKNRWPTDQEPAGNPLRMAPGQINSSLPAVIELAQAKLEHLTE